jgi:hypothetical protein
MQCLLEVGDLVAVPAVLRRRNPKCHGVQV